jgi:RNA polymerase sigma factor for flagellar operon FliA
MSETLEHETASAEEYLPFVRKIAGRIARRLPQSVDIDDLMGAGTVGLMEALDRYEPNSDRSFETYAEFRIKGAILDELRRCDPLNRAARTSQSLIARKTATLTAELGRPPEAEEVAAAMNTSLESFMSKLSPLGSYRTVPMDAEALLAGDEVPNQEEQLAQKEMVRLARRALEKLSQRQQLVLNLYYVEELNQAQIGEVLGVTESRICQILGEALKQLRKHVHRATS